MPTYCWKRLDRDGLELMQLSGHGDAIEARSTIIDGGAPPFSLTCAWRLEQWRTRILVLERRGADGVKRLEIERAAHGWRVDGRDRPDLAACLEVDVSATPFCNGLALHALKHEPGELTALYVNAADLSITPSRQAYARIAERRWRYIDQGVAAGFTAVLDFDGDGIVERYEGLFERLSLGSA